MNRRRVDVAVGLLVTAVLIGGGALTWQAYQQRRAVDQMMEPMMGSNGSMHGLNPLWYVFGTLLIAAVLGGVYLILREGISTTDGVSQSGSAGSSTARSDSIDRPDQESQPAGSINPEAQPRERVLDLLPDDERRILEPVLTSPGITQVELRDRAGFSKSKVSQTVSALEKRGLLYRERQGRTYRIYPSDDLQDQRMER